MFNIGPLELMVILLLALVVVGPSRLPEVGRSIGKGLRELRKVQDEVRDSINFDLDAEPKKARPAPRTTTRTTPAPRSPRGGGPPATADDEPAVPATPIEPESAVPATSEVGAVDPVNDATPDPHETAPPAGATSDEPPPALGGSAPAIEPPRE